jgi:hypothetical protein
LNYLWGDPRGVVRLRWVQSYSWSREFQLRTQFERQAEHREALCLLLWHL